MTRPPSPSTLKKYCLISLTALAIFICTLPLAPARAQTREKAVSPSLSLVQDKDLWLKDNSGRTIMGIQCWLKGGRYIDFSFASQAPLGPDKISSVYISSPCRLELSIDGQPLLRGQWACTGAASEDGQARLGSIMPYDLSHIDTIAPDQISAQMNKLIEIISQGQRLRLKAILPDGREQEADFDVADLKKGLSQITDQCPVIINTLDEVLASAANDMAKHNIKVGFVTGFFVTLVSKRHQLEPGNSGFGQAFMEKVVQVSDGSGKNNTMMWSE